MLTIETGIYEYPPIWDISTPEGVDALVQELAGEKICLTDADETFMATADAFIHALQKQYGYTIKRTDIVEYGIEKTVARVTGLPKTTAQKITLGIFGQPQFYATIEPHEDVIDALKELDQHGHQIVVVTHRAKIEKAQPGITQGWIHRHNIPCSGVIFANPDEKVCLFSTLANQVAPGSIFLEDHPTTAANAIASTNGSNITVGLIRRPWTENSGMPTITADQVVPLALGTLNFEP